MIDVGDDSKVADVGEGSRSRVTLLDLRGCCGEEPARPRGVRPDRVRPHPALGGAQDTIS